VAGTATPLTAPVTPGTGFDYRVTAGCSSLTVGCQGVVTTDVLPPGVTFVGFTPGAGETVTVSGTPPAQQTVTITCTAVLAPPNPAGSVGIPAGSSVTTILHVQLSPTTTAPDGSTLTNTADSQGTNTNEASASADITINIPTTIVPVASKSVTPPTIVAQSQGTVSATLGVSNQSTGPADVSSLTLLDNTTAAMWNNFDLASIGQITYPAGADQVVVGVCTTTPVRTPDTFSAVQSGTTISLPSGVAAADVTGIEFTFSNSRGDPLPNPPTATAGSVPLDFTLRSTDRTSGATIDPTTNQTVQNCATPSAVDVSDGTSATGTNACANVTILPGVNVRWDRGASGRGDAGERGRPAVHLSEWHFRHAAISPQPGRDRKQRSLPERHGVLQRRPSHDDSDIGGDNRLLGSPDVHELCQRHRDQQPRNGAGRSGSSAPDRDPRHPGQRVHVADLEARGRTP
jgi:hypothetical protein